MFDLKNVTHSLIVSPLQIFLTTAGNRNITDVQEKSSFVQISPFMIILKTHPNIKSKRMKKVHKMFGIKSWYPLKIDTI